jgi:hypothetical protein
MGTRTKRIPSPLGWQICKDFFTATHCSKTTPPIFTWFALVNIPAAWPEIELEQWNKIIGMNTSGYRSGW